MQRFKKIDLETNVLVWFEISVQDIQRAKKFYETILNIEMIIRIDNNAEAMFFPRNPSILLYNRRGDPNTYQLLSAKIMNDETDFKN